MTITYSRCNDNRPNNFLRLPPLPVCRLCIIHGLCHMLSSASVPASLPASAQRHVLVNYIVIYLTFKKKKQPGETAQGNVTCSELAAKAFLEHPSDELTGAHRAVGARELLLLASVPKARKSSAGSRHQDSLQQLLTHTGGRRRRPGARAHQLGSLT